MVQAREKNGRFTSNSNGANGPSPDASLVLSEANQNALVRAVIQNSRDMVANLSDRSRMSQALSDPRRDIHAEAGYPGYGMLRVCHYQQLYDRESIARRVVEVLPRESWLIQPEVRKLSQILKSYSSFRHTML